MRIVLVAAVAASLALVAAPLHAKNKDEAPELVRCQDSLGSPRALINALEAKSGCFTIDNPNDTAPARFLVTAIAGSAEEVDQGMELAEGAATEALVRSRARRVPCCAACRAAARITMRPWLRSIP